VAPEESPEAAVCEVILNHQGIPTDHALRPATAVDAEETDQGAPAATGKWEALGVLPPQLLRCLRVLLADEPMSVELDAPPGGVVGLDTRCLEVIEDLLQGLLEPLTLTLSTDLSRPLWWPQYGDLVEMFLTSQRELLAANLSAAAALRRRLQPDEEMTPAIAGG